MKALEKRILEVSKLIADYNVEAILQFQSAMDSVRPVDGAMKILAPELKDGEKALQRVFHKHNLDDDLFNDFQNTLIQAAYTVGIIAGLHHAGRAEIVPALAKIYEETAFEADFTEYDDDGGVLNSAGLETRN